MSRHLPDKNEFEQQLETELARFKELNAKKTAAYMNLDVGTIQAYELLRAQWEDSVAEIKHLHRKLYPYFPRSIACPHCGCDTLPIGGGFESSQCIACGEVTVKWNL